MGRGGRQDCEDYVEAAIPAADRRDCRAELLHHAGAASKDRSLQGNRRSRWLRSISIPQGRVSPRRQRAWEKFDGYVPRQEPAEWSSGGKIANFQRIEWKIISDATTASAALQNGEVDWYEQAQADLVPLLRRNSDIVIAPSHPQGYIGGAGCHAL